MHIVHEISDHESIRAYEISNLSTRSTEEMWTIKVLYIILYKVISYAVLAIFLIGVQYK